MLSRQQPNWKLLNYSKLLIPQLHCLRFFHQGESKHVCLSDSFFTATPSSSSSPSYTIINRKKIMHHATILFDFELLPAHFLHNHLAGTWGGLQGKKPNMQRLIAMLQWNKPMMVALVLWIQYPKRNAFFAGVTCNTLALRLHLFPCHSCLTWYWNITRL